MSVLAIRLAAAAVVLLLALLTPLEAIACGMPLRARIPAEQALIIYSGDRQQIITSVQLEATEPGAAVVFPVPGVPEVELISGGDQLFSWLEEATKPTERVQQRVRWRDDDTVGGRPTGGVSLLGRELLGGYDVARLAANDPGELLQWLQQNGYSVPAAMQPALDAYVAEGWKFVAVRLADDAPASGALAPLGISFPATQIVYPLRFAALADRPLDLQLYVLSDHRVEIDGMQTLFAGPAAQLSPPPVAELAQLMATAPFLTKLRNPAVDPATVKGDLMPRRAANDELYREVVTVYRYVSPTAAYGLPLALGCGVMLNVIAIAGAIAIRKRIDRI